MKDSLVKLAFATAALVLGAALEDLLPPFGEVGFPVLLGLAVFFASALDSPGWIVTAVAAGALEDALSSLPPATSIVFFAAAATAARFFREPLVWTFAAYPAFQLWLALVADGTGFFSRFLLSFPAGALAVATVFAVVPRLWGKAGADA